MSACVHKFKLAEFKSKLWATKIFLSRFWPTHEKGCPPLVQTLPKTYFYVFLDFYLVISQPYLAKTSPGSAPLCLDLLIFSHSTTNGKPVSFSTGFGPDSKSTADLGMYLPLPFILQKKICNPFLTFNF